MRYVFVSSTFKDMQFERDEVKNRLTPRIDTFLSSFGENVYFGDLRWGVNTSEMSEEESAKKVLKVCLDEIDDCRPYMIVFIGERYGWIPASELMKETMDMKGIKDLDSDISVTNLEIEYGALINPDLEGRILFYFRNLDTSLMNEEEKIIYESESPIHKEKLESLKRRIKELYPDYVREYDAIYNPKNHRVENLSPLMEMVYDDLTRIFKIDIDKYNELKPYQRAIKNSETRFERYYKGAYLRKDLDYHLETYKDVKDIYQAKYEELPMMLAIGGEAGMGKNTYLATLYEESLKDKNVISVPFVTGLDKYTKGKDELIDLIIGVVLLELKQNIDQKEYDNDPIYYMGTLLNKYSKGKKKLIRFFIMNANDEILKVLRYINFLLELNLRNISFYVALEERNSDSFKNNVDSIPFHPCRKIVNVNEIEDEEKYDLIKSILANKHKELPISIINKIMEKPESGSPLYLSLIIERLLILDHEDFENIRHLGDGMVAIEKYMSSIVDDAGEDIKDIAKELLKEACQRINPKMIPIVLRLLSYDFLLTTPQIEEFFRYMKLDYSEIDFSLFVHYIPSLFKESSISASKLEFRTYDIKLMAGEVADEFKVKNYKKDIINFLYQIDEDELIKDKLILEACYRFQNIKEFASFYIEVLKKFYLKLDDSFAASEYEIEIKKYIPTLNKEASKNNYPFFVDVGMELIDYIKDNDNELTGMIVSNIFNVLYFNLETFDLKVFWAYSFIDLTTYIYEEYKKDRDNDVLFFMLAIMSKYVLQFFDTAGFINIIDEEYDKISSLDEFREEFDKYDEDRENRLFQKYFEYGFTYDNVHPFIVMASSEYFFDNAIGEEAEAFFESSEEYILMMYKNYVEDDQGVMNFLSGKSNYLDDVNKASLILSVAQRFFLSASKAYDEEEEDNIIYYYEQFKKLLFKYLASEYFVPEKTTNPILSQFVLSHVVSRTIFFAESFLEDALSKQNEEIFNELYFDTIQYGEFEARRYLVNYPNDLDMMDNVLNYISSLTLYSKDGANSEEAKEIFAYITPFIYSICGREDDVKVLKYYVSIMGFFVGSFYKNLDECNTVFIKLIARRYYLCLFDKEEEDAFLEMGRLIYQYMHFTDQMMNKKLIKRINDEFFEIATGLDIDYLKEIIKFVKENEGSEEED